MNPGIVVGLSIIIASVMGGFGISAKLAILPVVASIVYAMVVVGSIANTTRKNAEYEAGKKEEKKLTPEPLKKAEISAGEPQPAPAAEEAKKKVVAMKNPWAAESNKGGIWTVILILILAGSACWLFLALASHRIEIRIYGEKAEVFSGENPETYERSILERQPTSGDETVEIKDSNPIFYRSDAPVQKQISSEKSFPEQGVIVVASPNSHALKKSSEEQDVADNKAIYEKYAWRK